MPPPTGVRRPEVRTVDAGTEGVPVVALRPSAEGPRLLGTLPPSHDREQVTALLVTEGATGELGQLHTVTTTQGRLHAFGAGAGDVPVPVLRWRRAGAALARRARDDDHLSLCAAGDLDPAALGSLVEGLLLASYAFSVKPSPRPWRTTRVDLAGAAAAAPALARAQTVATATHLARDLQNTPSLTKSPAWLAARAQEIAAAAGLAVEVLDEQELADQGYGGVVAVGRGSSRPPRLVRLRYTPAGAPARPRRGTPHVVLVGKGVTFDSGGLSLKPNEGMVAMKTDMSGAAVVIAVASALRERDVQVPVTVLAPMAENLPGGAAMRPGDVVTHWPGVGRGGRTTEVLNTDAEGRLLLADALASAVGELAPTHLVDVATLTGAMTLALGRRVGGFFASDDALAADLLAASEAAGERLWRMPLVEDYRDAVDSPVADLLNTGDRSLGYSAGTITAALFLREFTGGLPWAHLDIAGAGRSDSDVDELTKGGTGYAVATLLSWLETLR